MKKTMANKQPLTWTSRKIASDISDPDLPTISQDRAIKLVMDCFDLPPGSKLTDAQCAALNHVMGFNNFWVRKTTKRLPQRVINRLTGKADQEVFPGGSWRWFAGWCAQLCEESKFYDDYYLRMDLTEEEQLLKEQLIRELHVRGWKNIEIPDNT